MRRYSVPRVVFVNKLDRVGANPWKVIQQAREKLKLNAAAVQVRQAAGKQGGWEVMCFLLWVCGCMGGWVRQGQA